MPTVGAFETANFSYVDPTVFYMVVVVQYFNCQVSSVIHIRIYAPRYLTLNCCNRTTSGLVCEYCVRGNARFSPVMPFA